MPSPKSVTLNIQGTFLSLLRLYLYSRVLLLRFRYGEHLFKEQVAELVRPPSDTLELVRAWLVHHGIRRSSISTTHGGAWLTVTDVLVSRANQLLGASYELYRNTKTNETITRTVGYALPAVLHAQIEDVSPTTYFVSTWVTQQTPRRRSFRPAQEQARSVSRIGITPSILRWLYGTETYVAAANGRNRLGVVGFSNQYPSQGDLNTFTTNHAAFAAGARFSVLSVGGGGYDPNNPSGPVNTNTQYSVAMGYPTPVIFYSIGSLGDPFTLFLGYLLHAPDSDIPQTISITYSNREENVPPGYAIALCNAFAQLGLRGISVLVGSGVDGVGDGDCVQFVTEFPSACTCGILSSTTQNASTGRSPDHHDFAGPWVTSVGAAEHRNPEYGAIFSGGGFSHYFPRPPYQRNAVPTFLQRLQDRYEGLYRCARYRDPDPFLTFYFVQLWGSWLPRHLRASDGLHNRPQLPRAYHERYELRGFGMSLATRLLFPLCNRPCASTPADCQLSRQ